jgi:hypothetical protein
MAVAMEGSQGGLFGKNTIYGLSADFWIFTITIPLFLLIAIIVHGFESKFFGVLLIGYFIGTILEDFFWFVVNPSFGVTKFNSEYATWLKWSDFGFFELPTSYIYNFLLALVCWFVFVRNSKRIDKYYKLLIKNFIV